MRGKGEKTSEFFGETWRPEWPYDWNATETRLDPRQIERQAGFLLSRALNIRRTIAFLGAGASIPYGRVSWSELARVQIAGLRARRWTAGSELARLSEQLRTLEAEERELSGDENVLALQLCEQMWSLMSRRELGALCEKFGISDALAELDRTFKQPELGRQLMRAWIKRETFDELPHVGRLLAGNLRAERGKIFAPGPIANSSVPEILKGTRVEKAWRKAIREICGRKELRRDRCGKAGRAYLSLFSGESLEAIRLIVDRAGTQTEISRAAIELIDLLRRRAVSPPHYYIFGLVCDLLRLIRRKREVRGPKLAPGLQHAGQRQSRDDIIDKRHDPLRMLAFDLDIRRFLTTNYDMEVERLFVDYGFELPQDSIGAFVPAKESERIGPLGGRTRDIVLNEQTAAELVDFAVHDTDYEFQVVHLHGRATDDAEIVVTERDYQLKYLRDGDHQRVFREGLDLAFGGNPILFVGLGLSEGDVMRPMRQFAAGLSRRNRSLIALRPANNELRSSDLFTMQQYSRHGVHVAHFGFETNGTLAERIAKTSWLGALIDADGAISRIREAIKGRKRAGIRKAWGGLLKGLPAGMGVRKGGQLRFVPFHSDRGSCDVTTDLEAIRIIVELAEAALTTAPELCEGVLPIALDRAKASIVTAALCAKLEGVKRDWDDWWTLWQKQPAGRETSAVYENYPSDKKSHHRYLIAGPAFGKVWPYNKEARVRASFAEDSVSIFEKLVGTSHTQRRIFVIPGKRGSGKGLIFSALRERSRKWKQQGIYEAALFATFSFSTEIASVWDQLIAFLHDPSDLNAHTKSSPRIPTLERLVQRRSAGRLLIVLNAFDALFDATGTPKTAEIHEVLDLLLGRHGSDCPIDLVLLVRTSKLPCYFRNEPAPPPGAGIVSNAATRCGPLRLECGGADLGSLVLPEDYEPLRRLLAVGAAVSAPGLPGRHSLARELVSDEAGGEVRSCYVIVPLARRGQLGNGKADPLGELVRASGYRGLETWNAANKAAARAPQDPAAWNEIRVELEALLRGRRPRFHITLILAVLFDMTARHRPDRRSDAWPGIIRFLRDLRHLASGVGGPTGERQSAEGLIELVLDYWFQEGSEQAGLAEHIVRHLAVIGMPVRTDILLGCPLIGLANRRPVEELLEKLAQRGLVFKLQPRNDALSKGGRKTWRWTVHRAIQHFVYRRLGAQRLEPADAFLFAPSLYATQTQGHVQLNARAYAFIYDLVDHLVYYPNRTGPVLRFRNADEPRRAEVAKVFEGLRAAIGVIRTLFSIGVVSRFDDLDGLDFQLPPKLGYFEHHRLVIRWMIRLAGTLQEKLKASEELWPPFYRDELVWLYNECGVFSLAQGEIYDAHALLGMAATINRRIEGGDNGPVGRRLALNRCICQIERGRLDDAEDGFGRIFSSEREELLKEVARGYLGLVHHIKGRLDVAERLYEESIGALVAMDRFRPVSILKRHYGDMLRLVGRFEDAEREYRAAERGATAGGNMDLVHMAQVTMARLRFAQGIVDDTARRLLDEATAYADTMELPRLKAESLFARGEALLHSGETTLAGDFAVRALRIATLNGLALRKAAYAELMVRIYRARGDDHAADVLLAKTIKAARGQGYNVLINRIASASHGSTRTTRAVPAHSAAAGTTGSVVPQASNSKGQRG